MSRPYYNRISKSGSIVKVDTKIKRRDVINAITSTARIQIMAGGDTAPKGHELQSRLLSLPPEIRNLIYMYALDIEGFTLPNVRVPKSWKDRTAQNKCTNALRLCKQIAYEAESLMTGNDVAYITIMGCMDFAEIIDSVLTRSNLPLPATQITMSAALIHFQNVHLHLHTEHWSSQDLSDPEPFISLHTAYVYGRLRQALIIFTCASAIHFAGVGNQRRAMVHFDHFFSDWRHMLSMAGPYKLIHLLGIMGEDTTTSWEVRYYVHTGGSEKALKWNEWDQHLTRHFKHLQSMCAKFQNIKLIAEVYGEMTWSLEGTTSEMTRCVTPSSTIWPSWPDDVPWRQVGEVESDRIVASMSQ